MLQVATTWQSALPRKARGLLGPCIPQPTTPIVMRLDGAVAPPRPKALAGMIVGAAAAMPVSAIKCLRVSLELREVVFIVFNDGSNVSEIQAKERRLANQNR